MTPQRISMPEFVALAAMLYAAIAFSIDAMLPALPRIASELSPLNVNAAQLVVTSFVLGMGIGTLVAGPLSDSLGRRKVIFGALILYIAAGLWAMQAQSLNELLIARIVHGFAAAGPRIVTVAIIRDHFEGRRMAQVVSFVMTVFVLVPSMAPTIGTLIIDATGTWRAIFASFAIFGAFVLAWFTLRQPETLPPERRLPFSGKSFWQALKEILGNRMVCLYIFIMTLGFSQLFAFLSSLQQLYADVHGRGDDFHLYFMAMGLLSGCATLANAQLVIRLGMRRLAIFAYGCVTLVSLVILGLDLTGLMPVALSFPLFFFWGFSLFAMAGLTLGNLNALALQPLGHVAGTASSVIGAVSTIGAVPIAALAGLAFNGTQTPIMICCILCSGLAYVLLRRAREIEPAPNTSAP